MYERRKRLLQQRLRSGNLAAAAPVAAAVRRAGVRSPLSAPQQRMWFLQTLDPEDTTLNVSVAYRLDGELDGDRLRSAFAALQARHEVLRTTYLVDDSGAPAQIARDDAELCWQDHDLSDLPEPDRARRVAVLARRESARPFDLTAELPLRALLLRTGPAEHVLVLVIHHIAVDDDSWPALFADVSAAYRGTEPEPLQAQYIDVADTATPDDVALDYWRAALTPLPEPIELPGGRAGSGTERGAARFTRTVPAELLDRVATVGRAHGATPFMVLLAAFEATLHRYTAATDFLVAVPVTDRRDPRAQPLIGYFGNTLLVRADLPATGSFTDLLTATRDRCSDAFAYIGVGVDQVVRAVRPDRVAGRDALARLTQVAFAMRNAGNGFDLPGVTATELEPVAAVATDPLELMVVVAGDGGAELQLTYRTEQLDGALVARMLDHYLQLLDTVLTAPDRPLRDVAMLTAADRAAILELSHGELIAEPAATLVELWERRVAQTPAAIAVSGDDDMGAVAELSYAELNRRANRLAHWLIERGVEAEDLIALRMTTSVEFVVAILAIMKAGAAYLPIDPAYPAGRIDYLLADARPALEFDRAGIVAAEADAAGGPDTDPVDADRNQPLRPGNLAYVIYTSGSTGKPKGVPVPHAAIAEHVTGFVAEWSLSPEDRVLQSSSVSFDASMLDIFVTLVAGARIVVPKHNAYQDLPYVTDLIARHGVTTLHMVPSMLATFLLLPEMIEWQALRHVPVGGEALPGDVADRFGALFDAELRNHYGPTEAVVCSTHQRVDGPQGTRVVPIGTPNRNVYTYVLDSALRLVPAGVVGELYLGGNQLARGYLNRAGATAQRFVADPFRTAQRIYRTGDLVRRNESGELEFVGRADEQVKVRGFRIELGEVETAVAAHPGVAHCVVVVTEHEALGPILAAYVVPAGTAPLDLREVRAQVRAALPEHMVPSAFAVIDEIPLTAHGKLDRRALPEPLPAVARTYREPSTPVETRVAAIYRGLFERERIGADDSFFELGGHSLLAARLITLVRTEFGLEIDVRVPFDTPTVSGLAAHLAAKFRAEFGLDLDEAFAPETDSGAADSVSGVIAAATAEAARAARPPITRRERTGHLPLSYSQRAYWIQRRMEGAMEGENVPFAVRFDGPLDVAAVTAAVADVVGRHESLRTTFPEHEGDPYQLIHPAGPVPVPVTDLTAHADPQAALDRELDEIAGYAFDLADEPLVRVRLFTTAPGCHVLSVLMHHIIADRSASEILVADLITAYRARIRGAAPEWPTLDRQFADFAVWQREMFDHGAGGELSPYGTAQLGYWRTALAGLPDELAIAHDRPRPPVLGRNGIGTARTVPTATWRAVKDLAEQYGVTDFMLCQAVSAVLLNRLGGGADVPIGAAVANRVGEGAAELVGLFANVVVLRNDLSGDPTIREVLSRVRESALGAISHQDVPFERVVEALNPARSLARNPLFQVMMHVRTDTVPLDLTADGGTTATPMPREYEVSFMDFHLDFTLRAGGDVALRVVVNPDLYEAATGEIFADVLVRVVTAMGSDPDARLSALDVLPANWDPTRSVARTAAQPVSRWMQPGGEPPRTDTERALATLLEELLGITDVTRDDAFFGLGGDSVIAIQWSTRAAEAGLPLTPQLVFEHYSIAELAAAVDAAAESSPPEPEPQPQLAPMAASGLDADMLASLQASWAAQR
ncbi:non-ribosomal peptide synthetase [Nocardia stercoris]|uniref:Amino acid adenylation domain-containing protein n=1 Tax=Nocardia stercoris TaxID=2483361 RepID=A0A3M2KVA5_9NOCA|nr:non-ribosomal peptide synthetase [Nocardia stercoris]RMI28370.1 amino acid adenylation domain-containing protein [Nocardia stercoris]